MYDFSIIYTLYILIYAHIYYLQVAASLAVWVYSIAELPELLPRDMGAPTTSSNHDDTLDITVITVLGVVVLMVGCFIWDHSYGTISYYCGSGNTGARGGGIGDTSGSSASTDKLYSKLNNDADSTTI